MKVGFNVDFKRYQYICNWNVAKNSMYSQSTRLFAMYRHHELDSKWHDGIIINGGRLKEKQEYMFYEGQFRQHMETCNQVMCPCQPIKEKMLIKSHKRGNCNNVKLLETKKTKDDDKNNVKDTALSENGTEIDEGELSEEDNYLLSLTDLEGKNRLKHLHLYWLEQAAKNQSSVMRTLLCFQLLWYFENLVSFRRN